MWETLIGGVGSKGREEGFIEGGGLGEEKGFMEGGGLGEGKGFVEGGGLERNGLLCERGGGRARLLDGCVMRGGVVEAVGVGEGVVVPGVDVLGVFGDGGVLAVAGVASLW